MRQKEKENGKSGMLMLVYSTNVHIGTRPCVIVPAVTGRRPVTLHGPVRAVFDSLIVGRYKNHFYSRPENIDAKTFLLEPQN